MGLNTTKRILLVLCLTVQAVATAQVGSDIQTREAAANFVMAQAMTLGILREECHEWLAGTDNDAERIALAWWLRNRDDLDTANWVVLKAIERHRTTLPADAAAVAERQTLFANVTGSLAILRALFNRELPTVASCRNAVQQFAAAPKGGGPLGKLPEYGRVQEFSEALRRARAEPGFVRPLEKSRTLDAQVSPTEDPMATLDAIDAARERGDAVVMLRGFETLALRGDGKAAQNLGFIFLQGQLGQNKNPAAAYRWFYRAWATGEAEGLYSLGVMWRDGIGVVANQKVALAAFRLAHVMVGDTEPAGVRALANAQKIERMLQPIAIAEVGCSSMDALHQAIRSVVTPPPPQTDPVPMLKPGLLKDSLGIGPPNVLCN